jgi:hypothetical protein
MPAVDNNARRRDADRRNVVGEYYSVSRAQLEHMREESRMRQLLKNPPVWKPKAPPVPVEYSPPAKAKPLAIAMGLLVHELAVKAAPVAVLVAKAAKLGVSESTLRRAKKACAVSTVEQADGFYWDLTARLAG